jgi:hypothetical protein
MTERGKPASKKFFRTLVRALPLDFQANYGREMESVFEEQRREAEERGGPIELLKLWAETVAGIFRTAPREHWEILKSDCSYAFRMMRKNAGFTAIATLTLALGIGANTAIFSVVHSVLLRPLPYPKGQELVFVRQEAQKEGNNDIAFSVHEIQDYREQNKTLSGLVEYHSMSFILFGHGDPDRVRAAVVSANYFDLFEVKAHLGRTFLADDDKLGAPPVLILSYEYWKNKFGSDPGIVGKTDARSAPNAARIAGGGGLRSADRVRQCRESHAGADVAAGARTRGARGAGCGQKPPAAPTFDREFHPSVAGRSAGTPGGLQQPRPAD